MSNRPSIIIVYFQITKSTDIKCCCCRYCYTHRVYLWIYHRFAKNPEIWSYEWTQYIVSKLTCFLLLLLLKIDFTWNRFSFQPFFFFSLFEYVEGIFHSLPPCISVKGKLNKKQITMLSRFLQLNVTCARCAYAVTDVTSKIGNVTVLYLSIQSTYDMPCAGLKCQWIV